MFSSKTMIGRFRGPWGIPVEIDQSLLMLAGVLLYLSLGGSLVYGAIFAGMLIFAIYLHEVGHAWGCLVQDVPVRRIILHGGGGLCEHARAPGRRQQELIVAMGPLVNLAIWALCGVLDWVIFHVAMVVMPASDVMMDVLLQGLVFLSLFGWINLALFIFNMIPVQPLDGGKLFHLALLRVMPQDRAGRITGGIGFVLSLLWIPLAIWGFLTYGLILFYFPSPRAHYRMMRGQLAV